MRLAGGVVASARWKPSPETLRLERLLEWSSDLEQQIFWCIDLAGPEGLDFAGLLEMLGAGTHGHRLISVATQELLARHLIRGVGTPERPYVTVRRRANGEPS